ASCAISSASFLASSKPAKSVSLGRRAALTSCRISSFPFRSLEVTLTVGNRRTVRGETPFRHRSGPIVCRSRRRVQGVSGPDPIRPFAPCRLDVSRRVQGQRDVVSVWESESPGCDVAVTPPELRDLDFGGPSLAPIARASVPKV